MATVEKNNGADFKTTDNANESATKGNVRVLSREENYIYDGITIEANETNGRQTYHTGDYMSNFRIGNFTFSGDSIIAKIVLGAVVGGILFFLLFVALPIAVVILGVLLTIWLLLSFFQKR